MSDLPAISLDDCWAKTDPVTGKPALTLRDHCLIVGAEAEAESFHLPAVTFLLPEAFHSPPRTILGESLRDS